MKPGPVRRRGRSASDRYTRHRHRIAQDIVLVSAGLAVVLVSLFREVHLAPALGIGLVAMLLGSIDATWAVRRGRRGG